MKNFQPALLFAPDAPISLAPKRGFAFILDETPREAVKPVAMLAFDQAKLIVMVDTAEVFLRSRFPDSGAEAAEDIVTAFPQPLKAIEVHQFDAKFFMRQRARPA